SLNKPLYLYSLPLIWFASFYPNTLKAIESKRYLKIENTIGYNNLQPRSNIPNIKEKENIPPELAARLQRIEGAHANGMESLPFFGLAVLAGNWAGVDNQTLNIACGLHLICRIAYNYIYFNQTSRRSAGLR
ncbi:hypothetical protein CPB84DRAFT_1689632, partial [Gymnopilus junonius]